MADLSSFFSSVRGTMRGLGVPLPLFIAAISLAVGAYNLRLTYVREGNRFAAVLMREWNNDTDKYKRIIYDKYPDLALADYREDYAISHEQAIKIDKSESQLSKLIENRECQKWVRFADASSLNGESDICSDAVKEVRVREGLIGMLNYLEYIAVSYENETAAPDIIKESFREAFLYWFGATKEYIVASNEKKLVYWAPLVRVACEWNQEEPISKPQGKANDKICSRLLGKTYQ